MSNIKKKGFSMLEAVVAVGIVLFGLISIISLLLTSNIASKITSDELVAINLARETLEAARVLRDANWQKDREVWWGFFDSSDNTAIFSGLKDSNNWFDFTCNYISENCAKIWYDSSNNKYFQSSSSTGSNTIFFRLLTFQKICRADNENETIKSEDCDPISNEQQVGVAVNVEVKWSGRGGPSSYSLEEHLYDWK